MRATLVHRLGIATQLRAPRIERFAALGKGVEIRRELRIQRTQQLLAQLLWLLSAAVDGEAVGLQANLVEPALHDVERGALLGDEQHLLAVRERVGDEVGDRL